MKNVAIRSTALGSVVACITAALVIASTGHAEAIPPAACAPDAVQPGGAIYRLCMPSSRAWNGDLVIWAHGYVDFTQPVAIPEDQLCVGGGTFCLPDITTALGFGFITTSYRMNGLVTTGVEDVVELVGIFTAAHGAPRRVYLVGASEGGLVTALGVERRPDVFSGGLSTCGPIGDFNLEVSYFGDFRVLFDYFFPGLMPGSIVSIPPSLIENWDQFWTDTVQPTVFAPANAANLQQLLKTARTPFDATDPSTVEKSVHDALWYNVFATNDAIAKLGGQPFDNTGRHYTGSLDDRKLNATVQRVAADPAALANIDALLQTRGNLVVPVVNMHTTKDQQVPFVHELLYGQKLRSLGTQSERVLLPIARYGHCNFTPVEALLSFAILVHRVGGALSSDAASVLADPAERAAFRAGAFEVGLPGF